jgi:flagella basal body P-ring formation protein FlgA
MRIPRLLRLILPAALACASAAAAAADMVTLRETARIAPGAPVRLGDIAELSGDGTERLADIEIARGSAQAFELSIATVRERIADAIARDAELQADRTQLRFRGERVVVRPMRESRPTVRPDETPAAARPKATARPAGPTRPAGIDPNTLAGNGTPLGVVSELFCNAFGADADALRLHLSPTDLTRLEPKQGLRYEVRPCSALKADFVSFDVAALEGDRHVSRERVRVSVRMVREVCVATSSSRRGAALDEGTFTVEMREVAPSVASRAVDVKALGGASFARSIDAGTVIVADDLVRAAAIKRNDRVLVRREVGLVAIELEAIALQDGKPGDTIALQRVGAPRNRGARGKSEGEPGILHAEVVGSGRAVVR